MMMRLIGGEEAKITKEDEEALDTISTRSIRSVFYYDDDSNVGLIIITPCSM